MSRGPQPPVVHFPHKVGDRLRWLVVFLLLLVLVARITLGGGQDASLQRVREAGVLIVAFDASYPPFETTDGLGNFGGFDADLAREIAGRLGVEVQFANIAFDSLYDALASRKTDLLLSALRYEAERTRDVIYTMPYFDAGQVLIVREADTISRTADLAGRSVGVELASEAEIEIQKLAAKTTGMQIRSYETPEQALAALRNRAVDAVATDHVTALEMIKNLVGLRLVLPPFAPDLLVGAGHIQDRTLMKEVNRILKLLGDEGVLLRLQAQAF